MAKPEYRYLKKILVKTTEPLENFIVNLLKNETKSYIVSSVNISNRQSPGNNDPGT